MLGVFAGCGSSESPVVESSSDRVRKQVYELTISDLERYPVWEFALDEEGEPGQDEATVKPRPDLEQVDPGEGMFVVRARFIARDGAEFAGFVTPTDESGDVGSIQPSIVTPDGHVAFWFGIAQPSREDLDTAYRRLNTTKEALFPLTYETAVDAGTTSRGEIPAFLYLAEDGETARLD